VINLIGQHEWLLYFHLYLKGIPIVHTLHEVSPHFKEQKIANNLLSYIVNKNVPVIVPSKSTFDRFMDLQLSEKLNKIKIIPFGVFESYQMFDKKPYKFDKFKYVLWYGFIKPYKGLSTLYQAVNLLRGVREDVKFIVAGAGFDPVLDKMKQNSRFIIINNLLSNEDIVDLNINAEFIVCPYISASQSGILATTFFFKKPIIASKIDAFTEFIDDETNGLLINADEPKELADGIVKLLFNKELYSKLCNESDFFTKNCDWNKIAEKTEQFYKEHI
jgi:glycosyltransferase involved in cell wall biosynthesis